MSIFGDDPYQHVDHLYIRRRASDYDVLLTLVRCGWGGQIIQVEEPFERSHPQRFKTPMLLTRNQMYSGEKEIYQYINRVRHERHRNKFVAKKQRINKAPTQ